VTLTLIYNCKTKERIRKDKKDLKQRGNYAKKWRGIEQLIVRRIPGSGEA
jgi:hypothetical protein